MTDAPPEPAFVPAPPDDSAPAPRRMVPAAAFVAAVMVAAVLGILAVIALTSTGGGGDDEQRQARRAAGQFTERFLTFDHDDLDQWKSDALSLSTGGFAGEVEEVEAGLRRLIGESELDARTQVTDVFIGEVDRGSVSAVVIYDRSITGPQPRSETDRYLQLDLVKVDGVWLVDNVIDIATAGGIGARTDPVPAPSTTSTTAG